MKGEPRIPQTLEDLNPNIMINKTNDQQNCCFLGHWAS